MSSKRAKKRVSYQDSQSRSSVPDRLGSSTSTEGFHGSLAENQAHHGTGRELIKGHRSLVTIDVLPDLALLTIFDFYIDDKKIEMWQTLVHVCRKWRNIVFGSPRRLKLRLCCTAGTLRGRKLDVWPRLPIVVRSYCGSMGNLIAALKHNNRICGVNLDHMSSSNMEQVLAALQRPFPSLTSLELGGKAFGDEAPVVSASFLGGSAPSLESLRLRRIPFPGIPNLLLSATRLVNLQLLDIPHSGYISPETMITTLSVLTKLEKFQFSFDSPQSRPRRKSRPQFPQTRTVLPVLTGLWFGGAHQYFEALVAQIDVPQLDELYISFPTFSIPPLTPFITRIPKSKPLNEARVFFSTWDDVIRFKRKSDEATKLEFSCSWEEPDDSEQQISWAARLCGSSLPRSLISDVEHLYIEKEEEWSLNWELINDETEFSQWLELLRPFTSVKCLYPAYGFQDRIARALKGCIGERVTEVLPALQTLFLQRYSYNEGSVQKELGPFIAARQLSGHPITISLWDD